MTWTLIISLIAKYGLPLAESLWTKWRSGAEPTDADWAELRKLSEQTAHSQILDGLKRAGIDVESEEAKNLLALVEKN